MDRFSYGGFLFLFLTPVIYILWKKHKKTIKKYKKLIIIMAIVGAISFFVMMPIAAYWGAWIYDYSKTSNIRIGSELIETCIWQIISCMILAVVVSFYAEKEEKKKPFWPL